MAYIVDPINNTLIDDEKPFKKKEYKQLEFDFSEKKKDVPVRKPGAVPPKTQTIKKFKDGSKPIVRKENLDERIQRMVYQINNIETITTKTEAEAFLLESNLIKKNKPRFNIVLRDDKSLPYILISSKNKWPQISNFEIDSFYFLCKT